MVNGPKTKGEIRSHDDFLKTETRFGAYSVVLKSAKGLNELLRMGLGMKPEDQYIEVHVPDSVRGGPRAVLAAFRDGMVELADFLNEKRLTPGWLIGVTHRHVAKPAQRFLNFQVISGVPEQAVGHEKAERIAEGYNKAERREGGAAPGPLYLCYQSYASFMDFTERLRGGERAQRAPAGS